MTDLMQVAEQARDWIAEKPELRPCSAGKMVGLLTMAIEREKETLECCKDDDSLTAAYMMGRAHDTALLREAMGLLMQMPIKHPQQGEYRDDLIRRIRERLK